MTDNRKGQGVVDPFKLLPILLHLEIGQKWRRSGTRVQNRITQIGAWWLLFRSQALPLSRQINVAHQLAQLVIHYVVQELRRLLLGLTLNFVFNVHG